MPQYIDYHSNPAVIGKILVKIIFKFVKSSRLGHGIASCFSHALRFVTLQLEAHERRLIELGVYQMDRLDGAPSKFIKTEKIEC